MDANNTRIGTLLLWLTAAIMLWLGPGYFIFAILPGVDWPALAMLAIAAASGRLVVDLGGRGSGRRVQVALVHSALFGCAITLGPYGAMLASAAACLGRIVSERKTHIPLYRLCCDLFGPVLASVAAASAFLLCGGSVSWPQGADSLWALICAAAVYSCASAAAFGVQTAVERKRAQGPRVEAAAVAAGWCASLLGGYVLAIIYAGAPGYAVCAAAVVTVGAALALRPDTQQPAALEEPSAAKGHKPAEATFYVDPVTRLANRRYLDLFLDREMGRSQRLGKPLSVAVFNVDGFSRLDKDAGETVMTGLGRRLAEEIREYDIAARHSEARIVVVLPETSTDTAIEVAERLRAASADALQGRPLGISVGLASFPEHAFNARDLINAAHYALNRGRSESSDRVHVPENLRKAG